MVILIWVRGTFTWVHGDIWVPAPAKDYVNVHCLTTARIHVATQTTRISMQRDTTLGSVWVREMNCCQDYIHIDVFFKHPGSGCFSGLRCFEGSYIWSYSSHALHWFPWLLLPEKAAQIFRIWTDNLPMLVTEGQDATQTMLIHMACNVIRVWHYSNVWSKLWQGDMSDSAALLQPLSLVPGFYCLWKPCNCLRSVLPPWAMLNSRNIISPFSSERPAEPSVVIMTTRPKLPLMAMSGSMILMYLASALLSGAHVTIGAQANLVLN